MHQDGTSKANFLIIDKFSIEKEFTDNWDVEYLLKA